MRERTVGSLVVAVLIAGLPALASAPAQQGSPERPPQLDAARATLSKWVETQELIVRERKEWQQGKEILEARIKLLGDEIATLQDATAHLRSEGAEAGRTRGGLTHSIGAFNEAENVMAARVSSLEARLRSLATRLPTPAREKLSPLYSRIPVDPDTTKISLAERFQNVVGILNEVGKLNNEITMTREILTLSDGKPTEVQVVYVGLGQAYYIAPDHEEAGVGRPGDDGWVWEPSPGLGPKVLEVVEILQNKATPRFVALPVKVQ
jgi:hypothetical protein